jgi:hypothetical protein
MTPPSVPCNGFAAMNYDDFSEEWACEPTLSDTACRFSFACLLDLVCFALTFIRRCPSPIFNAARI